MMLHAAAPFVLLKRPLSVPAYNVDESSESMARAFTERYPKRGSFDNPLVMRIHVAPALVLLSIPMEGFVQHTPA